ncbi:MAG: glutathione S-transferase N-terminal domain-containing protein [Gammaproteobacteria bacterium]
MLTLYRFPVSHYCEKVRWALDYKQLDFQTKNLLPGQQRHPRQKAGRDHVVTDSGSRRPGYPEFKRYYRLSGPELFRAAADAIRTYLQVGLISLC